MCNNLIKTFIVIRRPRNRGHMITLYKLINGNISYMYVKGCHPLGTILLLYIIQYYIERKRYTGFQCPIFGDTTPQLHFSALKYSGVEQRGPVWTHLYIWLTDNWQHHTGIKPNVGPVLVYDDEWLRTNHRQLIIKNVETFFSLKRGLILRVVHSHRQRVWAPSGTAARTLIIWSGVCECARADNAVSGCDSV